MAAIFYGQGNSSEPTGNTESRCRNIPRMGRFAADKDSLYFDGERTDDNHGEKQVDMDSLQQVGEG